MPRTVPAAKSVGATSARWPLGQDALVLGCPRRTRSRSSSARLVEFGADDRAVAELDCNSWENTTPDSAPQQVSYLVYSETAFSSARAWSIWSYAKVEGPRDIVFVSNWFTARRTRRRREIDPPPSRQLTGPTSPDHVGSCVCCGGDVGICAGQRGSCWQIKPK